MAEDAALRFSHPTTGPDAGLRVTSQGGLQLAVGDEAIRQAILLLLSTAPGERVMRPDYGCHLDRLAFARNDATTAGLAIHYVRQALERWEPRIDIVVLDAEANPDDPGRLDLLLAYRVRDTAAEDQLVLSVDLEAQ